MAQSQKTTQMKLKLSLQVTDSWVVKFYTVFTPSAFNLAQIIANTG